MCGRCTSRETKYSPDPVPTRPLVPVPLRRLSRTKNRNVSNAVHTTTFFSNESVDSGYLIPFLLRTVDRKGQPVDRAEVYRDGVGTPYDCRVDSSKTVKWCPSRGVGEKGEKGLGKNNGE